MQKLNLSEIKERELNILKYIDSICKRNNIEYFVAYGTLLGAIRHKGFIPWDDDIDIFVPRPYYDKLKKIILQENVYGIESWDITNKYFFDYNKIYDMNTIIEEHTNVKRSTPGLFVDIFPLDGFGNSLDDAKRILKRAQRIKMKFKYANSKKLQLKNILGLKNKIKKTIAYFYSKISMLLFDFNRLIRKYEKVMTQTSYFTSQYVGYLDMDGGFMPISKLYKKEWIDGEERKAYFEGIQVSIPFLAEEVLLAQYGQTYMELPPENQRVSHCIEAYIKSKG